MTDKQRDKFWLTDGKNGGKNIVIVETNSGKTCFSQCGFEEVFGVPACTGLWDMSFEDAFEIVSRDFPWSGFYIAKKPIKKQLDQLIKYYNK